MSYKIIERKLTDVAIDGVYTELPTGVALGEEVQAVHPVYGAGVFKFLKGAASVERGSAVLYHPDDNSVSLAVANDIGQVAFAMGATVANTFGFYQIVGKAIGKVLTGFVDNANCYLTATAGSIDDAVVAGDYIYKCKGASAIGTPAAGLAELEIDRPFVKDGLDDAT
jgi:hypothetical protein